MADWYYSKGGNQAGPVSSQQLRDLVASGQLQPTDHVWKDGMAAWVPVSQVSGLSAAPAAPAAPAPAPAVAAAPAPASFAPAAAPAPQGDPALAQLAYATPDSMSAGVMANGRSLEMLRQTRPWVRLISVVMLIVAGFVLVAGLIQAFATPTYNRRGAEEAQIIQLIVMVVVAVIYGALAWVLSQYASGIGRLLKSRQEVHLEQALRAQRSFWMFAGILTLISVVLYAGIILFALAMTGRFF